MKKKSVQCILLTGIFVVLCFSGCSSKKGDGSNKNITDLSSTDTKQDNKKETEEEYIEKDVESPKTEEVKNGLEGRYVEEEIGLPEIPNNCFGILIQGKEDTIEYFVIPDEANIPYKHYIRVQNNWKEEELKWLKEKELELDKDNQASIESIFYGEDGFYYVSKIIYKPELRYKLYKVIEKENSLEEIKIPYLESTVNNENTNGEEKNPSIQKIDVMENGTIVINDMYQSKLLLSPSSNRSKLIEVDLNNYKDGYMRDYKVSKNQIIAVNLDGTSLSFYNADTNAIERTISLELNNNSYDTIKITQKKDNTVILADKNGIHRIKEDGTLLETTVEGQLNSMGMPSLIIQNIFVSNEDKEAYFIRYTNMNLETKFMSYYFDKTISAVPEEELTIYSLVENDIIKQAIPIFQRLNKNVKINYISSMESDNQDKSDYIRALNTEILEGNGADIFVLDNLPVESYIEKGVLLDISEVVKSFVEQNKIPQYMVQVYTKENQIFQLPTRIRIPVVYGEKDAIDAWNGLDSILDYIEKNKEKPYITELSGNDLAKLFYPEFEKKLVTEQNELDTNELKAYLRKIKTLEKSIEDLGGIIETEAKNVYGISGDKKRNIVFPYDRSYQNKSSIRGIIELRNVEDSMVPIALINKIEGEYKIINNTFIPCNRIGLNAQSKKKELAIQFLELLFSEEVQKEDVIDGFPVNEAAMNAWIQEDNSNSGAGIDLDGEMLYAPWPEEKDRKALLDKIKQVTNIYQTDETIKELILTETENYFKGIATIDQVTSNIKSKVDMYLAE